MVIRLGPLYGGTRVKDTLHDLINNSHIYYSRNTLYAYANVKWSANYIVDCICNGAFNNKTIEIGARNVISLGEIAEFVNSKSTFSNKIDTQFPLNFPVGPDAYDVLDYALALKRGYNDRQYLIFGSSQQDGYYLKKQLNDLIYFHLKVKSTQVVLM